MTDGAALEKFYKLLHVKAIFFCLYKEVISFGSDTIDNS